MFLLDFLDRLQQDEHIVLEVIKWHFGEEKWLLLKWAVILGAIVNGVSKIPLHDWRDERQS